MQRVNLHYIPQEFVGCGEWVEPWGTLQQEEEGNPETGEKGSPEREEEGSLELEQEGVALSWSKRGVALSWRRRGITLRGRRRGVPLRGCSRVGCRARGSSVKPYTWGRCRLLHQLRSVENVSV